MATSYTIPVRHTSFETMQEEGWEAHDNGFVSNNLYSNLASKGYLKVLTKRQRIVVGELLNGKSRKEIASYLMISEQAVHQMVLRIRKRLHEKAGISLMGWKRKHGGI